VLAAQRINCGRRGQRHGTHPSGASVVLPWLGRRIAGRNSQRRTGPWNPLPIHDPRKKVFLCPLEGLMSRAHWQTCNDLYPGLCKPRGYLHMMGTQRLPVSRERCTPSPGSERTQAQTLLDTSPSVVGPLPRASRRTIFSGTSSIVTHAAVRKSMAVDKSMSSCPSRIINPRKNRQLSGHPPKKRHLRVESK
jgi:hypothetical protein